MDTFNGVVAQFNTAIESLCGRDPAIRVETLHQSVLHRRSRRPRYSSASIKAMLLTIWVGFSGTFSVAGFIYLMIVNAFPWMRIRPTELQPCRYFRLRNAPSQSRHRS